jgi:hypothetical protein
MRHALALALLLAATPAAARAQLDHRGFWGSVGVGWGRAHVACSGAAGLNAVLCEAVDGAASLGVSVRLGVTVADWLRLGVEWEGNGYTAVASRPVGAGEPTDVFLGGAHLTAQLFPFPAHGAYLKLGAGLTTVDVGGLADYREDGLAYDVGVGYEVRVARRWRVAPEVSWRAGGVGDLPAADGGGTWRHGVLFLAAVVTYD